MAKTKKSSVTYYLIGTFVLLLILIAGIYFQGSHDLSTEIANYVYNKQEIADVLGDVVEISDKPFFLFMNEKNQQKISITVHGKKTAGTLSATALFQNHVWFLNDIKLKINDNTTPLSSLYIQKKEFYGASVSSAPLLEPLFLEGENIFIKFLLKGIRAHPKGISISENITIYNDNQELVSATNDAVHYQKPKMTDESDGIGFTNKISSLSPGLYYVQFKFNDGLAGDTETYWQEVLVKKTSKDLIVRSLEYFLDKEKNKKAQENYFKAEQNIYLRMNLEGFLVQDKKIAGVVDLKITNSEGETIAYKPKFAAFNQPYQGDHEIFIDGEINLKHPDIYFLTFKINDYFSKKHINHQEKIIVSLP
jgi:hypothetical protein